MTKKKSAKQYVLVRNLWQTQKEMRIYLLEYYIAIDEIEKMWEATELMNNDKALEKMRYPGKNPGQKKDSTQNDIDASRNILKE